jgi:hypothetical protein
MVKASHALTSGDEEDAHEDTLSEKASSASTPMTSLFKSPNEDLSFNLNKCLMAKTSEVTTSSKPSSKTIVSECDLESLKIKREIIGLDEFISNLQGEPKKHVQVILDRLAHANDLLDLKERFERENADEIGALSQALGEEQELREALEEKLSSIEEIHNETLSNLTKERDHAIALSNVLKKEKVEFGVGHAKLTKELEKLEKTHKALESEFSTLTKSHEQLQIQLTKNDMPCSSTSSCDHVNVIKENTRLKAKFAKSFPSQGEKNLDDLLSNQRSNNGKEGIGYGLNTNKNKKAKPAQAKEKNVLGGDVTRDNTTHNNFAGKYNPHYVLFRDYYGDVYAKYVGPYDGYIAWYIWVPKTLVTNKRGPIVKWGPKTKT